jgi:hypothetical protein
MSTVRPETDIEARQLPGFADTAIMTSAIILMALLIAAGINRNAEAFDAGMRAQCRADQSAAATAAGLIAIAEARPEVADQLDDHIAHLVDLTGGRTPQQIANLPQCRGVP